MYVSPNPLGIKPMLRSETIPAGRRGGRIPRDYKKNPYGSVPYADRFDLPEISRSEWVERIEAKDKARGGLSAVHALKRVPVLDQGGTNFCWANAPVAAVMVLQAMQGQAVKSLSPASVACPVTNFRNVGGWGAQSLKQIAEVGVCETMDWPANAIDRTYYTRANMTRAKANRFVDWRECEPGNESHLITCLLSDYPCFIGLDWWGHEVLALDAVILENGKIGIEFVNSWGTSWGKSGIGRMSLGKATDGDCFAAISATA